MVVLRFFVCVTVCWLMLLVDKASSLWILNQLQRLLPFQGQGDAGNDAGNKVNVLLGVPDAVAYVGKLFNHHIPDYSFQGKIHHLVVHLTDRSDLPDWMYFNHSSNTFTGIPSVVDTGSVTIEVEAFGGSDQTATTSFFLQIRSANQEQDNIQARPLGSRDIICDWDEQTIKATIILDTDLNSLGAKKRVEILTQWANYVSFSPRSLTLKARSVHELASVNDGKTLVAGPGDADIHTKKKGVELGWTIACGDFSQRDDVTSVLEHNIYNGNIKSVLGYHIIGWFVSEHLPLGGKEVLRRKRQIFMTPLPTASIITVKPTILPESSSILPTVTVHPSSTVTPTATSTMSFTSTFTTTSVTTPVWTTVEPAVASDASTDVTRDVTNTSMVTTPAPLTNAVKTPILTTAGDGITTVATRNNTENTSEVQTSDVTTVADNFTTIKETTEIKLTTESHLNITEQMQTEYETTVQMSSTFTQLNFTVASETTQTEQNKTTSDHTTLEPGGTALVSSRTTEIKTTDETNLTTENSTRFSFSSEIPRISTTSAEIDKQVTDVTTVESTVGVTTESVVTRGTTLASATTEPNLSTKETTSQSVQITTFEVAISSYLTTVPENLTSAISRLTTDMHELTTVPSRLTTPPADGTTAAKESPTTRSKITTKRSVTSPPRGTAQSEATTNQLASTPGLSTTEPELTTRAAGATTKADLTTVAVSTRGVQTTEEPVSTQEYINQAPELLSPVAPIATYLGTYFEYSIPANTFFDAEDGDTRTLRLQLFTQNMLPIQPSYWLQLDSAAQLIYGVAVSRGLVEGASTVQIDTVVLQARDSGNLTTDAEVRVTIDSSSLLNISHQFIVEFDISFSDLQQSTDMIVYLSRNFSTYFNDDVYDYVTITRIRNINGSSVHFIWTNNTVSKRYCQNGTVLDLYSQLTQGNSLEHLQSHFVPYSIVSVSMQWLGVCSKDGFVPPPEVNAKPQKEDDVLALWVIIVIIVLVVVVLIIVIIIIVCCVKRRQKEGGRYLPADEKPIISNNRKPVILDGEMEMRNSPSHKPRKPMVLQNDNDSPFAFSNPAYSHEKPRREPPPYAEMHEQYSEPEDSMPQEPLPLGAEALYPLSYEPAHKKPPPAYRLPPPYIEKVGSSEI